MLQVPCPHVAGTSPCVVLFPAGRSPGACVAADRGLAGGCSLPLLPPRAVLGSVHGPACKDRSRALACPWAFLQLCARARSPGRTSGGGRTHGSPGAGTGGAAGTVCGVVSVSLQRPVPTGRPATGVRVPHPSRGSWASLGVCTRMYEPWRARPYLLNHVAVIAGDRALVRGPPA